MAAKPASVAATSPACEVVFTHDDGNATSHTRASWEAAQNLIHSVACEVSGVYPISYRHALGLLADRGITVTADGEVLA